MGPVRIRHGVAEHVMKSRVRAYKTRAKRHWVSSELAGTYLPLIPTHSPDFMAIGQNSFESVTCPMECEALVLFDVDGCYAHKHTTTSPSLREKTGPNSAYNRNSTLFLLSQPSLSLQNASVSFPLATQPVCASSNPWKPGTVTHLKQARSSGAVRLMMRSHETLSGETTVVLCVYSRNYRKKKDSTNLRR